MAEKPAFEDTSPMPAAAAVKPAFEDTSPIQATPTEPKPPSGRVLFDEKTVARLPTTGRDRQRAYLESLHEGSTEAPAGREAPGPDLSAEQGKPGQLASEWGNLALGTAEGIPSFIAGSPGDIEQIGRGIYNSLVPQERGVSSQPYLPTTPEGGLLGTRHGLGWIPSEVDSNRAFGRTIPGMLLGTKMVPKFKGMPTGPDLPTVPPSPVVALPRPSAPGVNLLPPDVPHTPVPLPPGTSTVGAAGTSPLAGISEDTLAYLKRRMQASATTLEQLDADIEKLSPHQTLAEFDPNTEMIFSGLATKPNAKNEIINTFVQRDKERPERIANLVDDALGEKENLVALNKARIAEAKKDYDPLYQQFRSERVPPPQTPEIYDAMYAPVAPGQKGGIMNRLRAAGVFGQARRIAAMDGVPWESAFGGYGPIPEGSWPTSQSWNLIKTTLDDRIIKSYAPAPTGHGLVPTQLTRSLQAIKNDMMAVVDNDVWRQAREKYATPRQITNAETLGTEFFRINKNELPELLNGFNDAQKAGYIRGLRSAIDNEMGGIGNADLATVKKILSRNVQEKLDGLIGPDKTAQLVNGLEKEAGMTASGSRVSGRQQSITADRTAAGREWDPHEMVSPESSLVRKGIAHGTELAAHPMEKAREVATAVGDRMLRKKAQKIWEESARIGTLQGPERDAVLRYLLTPEQSRGGRVVRRAAGGRVTAFNPKSIGARRNPRDGNFYLPGKKPGTWFKVVPRNA